MHEGFLEMSPAGAAYLCCRRTEMCISLHSHRIATPTKYLRGWLGV